MQRQTDRHTPPDVKSDEMFTCEAMARHAKALEEAAEAAEAEGAGDDEGGGEEDEEESDSKKHAEAEKAEKKRAAEEAAAAALQAKEAAEEEAAEKRAAKAAAGGEDGEVEEEDPNAVEKAKFDEFVAHLYTCQVRSRVKLRMITPKEWSLSALNCPRAAT